MKNNDSDFFYPDNTLRPACGIGSSPRRLIILGIAWVSAILVISTLMTSSLWIVSVSLLLYGLALRFPAAALALLFFSIPLLGVNYPGSEQNFLFFLFFSVLTSGLGFRWTLMGSECLHVVDGWLSNPLNLWISAFIFCGLASLSSLPVDEVWVRLVELQKTGPQGFLKAKELSVLYPLLKVWLQIQAFAVFLMLSIYPDAWRPRPMLWLVSLLLGLCLSMGAGILDYYGWFRLDFLRPVATGLNEHGTPLRLQSFFGHPAWCAMFVTVAIPSVMALLEMPITRKAAIGFMISALVLGEFVLILTFARGGWIAYPMTLLAVWFSIYVLKPSIDLTGLWPSLRRSALKILVSIPLTVLISLALVYGASVWMSESSDLEIDGGGKKHSASGFLSSARENPEVERYVERFKTIAKTVDRTVYIPPTLALTHIYPILGGGSDSFSYRYFLDFVRAEGRYADMGNPLGNNYNNAHSLYWQMLAGRGLVGVLSYVSLAIGTMLLMLRLIQSGFRPNPERPPLQGYQRTLVLVTLCSLFSFSIYGIFDDVFYTPSLTVLFVMILSLAGRFIPMPLTLNSPIQRWAVTGVLALAFCQILWSYGFPGPTRELMAELTHQGCYRSESQRGPEGDIFKWCSDRFDLEIPVISEGQERFGLVRMQAIQRQSMPEVVKLRITAHNALVSETIVFAGHPFWLRVPSTAPDSLMPVRVETQHVWVPMFDSPEPSLDRRRLAVKVFEKTVTPLQSLGGQAECELKLQFREGDWEGTWCRTPGRLPAALHAGDGEQGFRVAAPIVDANHPVDVWIQKGLEKPYVVVVRDNSWQNMGRVVSGQEISLLASRSGLSSDGGELQFAWGRRSSHNP